MEKFKSFQKLKITLLKDASLLKDIRKSYAFKIKIILSTRDEINLFQKIQQHFFKTFFSVHLDSTRFFYVDLNANKKNDMSVMIYHVRNNNQFNNASSKAYFFKTSIQLILFLSRFFNTTKTRY